jgi:hypothetical protein
MSPIRTRLRMAAVSLLAPLAFGVLTACSGDNDRKVDEQLRADLLAASQTPGNRQQYASPAELGYAPYPQGYAPGYAPYPGAQVPGQYPQPYAQPYPPGAYPAPYPQPQPQVVYVPQQTTVRRTGTAGGSGTGTAGSGSRGTVYEERRNTQKGAVVGAATGAAIGVISSRDKAKGAAVGALGGAVLGGIIGHQVKTPPR